MKAKSVIREGIDASRQKNFMSCDSMKKYYLPDKIKEQDSRFNARQVFWVNT
jgi:hypothetical protein